MTQDELPLGDRSGCDERADEYGDHFYLLKEDLQTYFPGGKLMLRDGESGTFYALDADYKVLAMGSSWREAISRAIFLWAR